MNPRQKNTEGFLNGKQELTEATEPRIRRHGMRTPALGLGNLSFLLLKPIFQIPISPRSR
jgi:hypothetical protein